MPLGSFLKTVLGYHSWNSDEDQKRLIPDAAVVFDVGANEGQSARTYRRLYPKALIVSFEPVAETFAKLSKAFPGDARFLPIRKGLSDQPGIGTINLGAGSLTSSMLSREGHTGKHEEITLTTLDEAVRLGGYKQVDILKVDVEGLEAAVFAGGTETLRTTRAVFVEVYFNPVYRGMPLMWDLHRQLIPFGFHLHGLYSLNAGGDGRLSFANALYIRDREAA